MLGECNERAQRANVAHSELQPSAWKVEENKGWGQAEGGWP